MKPLASIGIYAVAVALGVPLLVGCTEQQTPPQAIQQNVSLQRFDNCSSLERYIEDTAVRSMRTQLDNIRDGYGGGVILEGDGAPPGGAPGTPRDNGGPAAYTQTNNQVAGVDEPDFVKNDGTRIFALSAQKLMAATSWPPQSLGIIGELAIEGWPTAMLLDEQDRVVVFSQNYDVSAGGGGPGGGAGVPYCDGFYGCWGGRPTTKLTVVDVRAPQAMRVIGEYYLPGRYTQARRIGGSVRVVLGDDFRWPEGIQWYPQFNSYEEWQDKELVYRAFEALKVKNEPLIRAQTLAQWLPQATRKLETGERVEIGYSCSDFYASNAPIELGFLTVATLNLDRADGALTRTSIVAQPNEVYASRSALYVTNAHWWWWPQLGQSDFTYLHKFDISNPDSARYLASGGVAGHIVDQFSLDEHEGMLRVATTIATRVQDPAQPDNRWGRLVTTNRVTVLAERGGRLVRVGETEELAPGERIYSARFMGGRGFVVTFRQVDPLFTLDLSNPTRPRRIGELKVPGFSTYLHPIDAGHLLAIGIYQPEPGPDGQINWQQRRLKLSLFDVTNFAAPREQFSTLVGTAYGWSEAAYDHLAFNFFAERKLLAIPFSDYVYAPDGTPWASFVSELRVFAIDPITGITPRGALSMSDVYRDIGQVDFPWYYSPWIRRSVMASDNAGNDYVYGISDAGIRVVGAAAMSTPIATARFAGN